MTDQIGVVRAEADERGVGDAHGWNVRHGVQLVTIKVIREHVAALGPCGRPERTVHALVALRDLHTADVEVRRMRTGCRRSRGQQ